MLHIVIDGMPGGTKGTLFAIGIVVDDVDTGNAGLLVDGHMVVSHTTAVLVWEGAAIASGIGCLPYTLHDVAGIVHGVGLTVELGTLPTYRAHESPSTLSSH